MRNPKKAGEEVQVDYAGLTVPVLDPKTGEAQEMQVFVGVLGASGYIYCEAHRSQSLPTWIRAHVHMFAFFRGVPRIVRPDNLKAGVKKACFYEPDINPTCHELAQHYNLAVIPARVAKPQDKGLIYLMLFSLRTPIFGALGLILFRGLDALKAPFFAEYQNKFLLITGQRFCQSSICLPAPAQP